MSDNFNDISLFLEWNFVQVVNDDAKDYLKGLYFVELALKYSLKSIF